MDKKDKPRQQKVLLSGFCTLRKGALELVERDFRATVHVAAFFAVVVILEGLALAHGGHAAGRHALFAQVALHCVGTILGKLCVVGVGTDGVGPAGQHNVLAGLALDDFGSFGKDALGLGVESIGVEGEVHATQNDDRLGLAAEHCNDKALESSVVIGKVFSLHVLGLGMHGSDGLQIGFAVLGVGKGHDVDNQIALGSVDLAGSLDKVHAHVVGAVGEQDDGGIALHAAQEGLVLVQAVTHVGQTAVDGEVALQLVDGSVHPGAIPGALGVEGAIGGDGVQAAVEGLIGNGIVDAMHHVLGEKNFAFLGSSAFHHHGARVVHNEVKAFDFLCAVHGSSSGIHRVAEHQHGCKKQETQSFHKMEASIQM